VGNFFVNPALLWGTLAVAAPIAIWLLTRYRYRTVEFAALEFLKRALRREQRRLRLENLILLIIRCLIVALIAIVVARPRSMARVEVDPEDKRQNVVVLLDTSYSMGYQIGSDEEETAYNRARRAARDLVSGLEEGDRICLLGFDETVRDLYLTPKNMTERGREEVLGDLEDAPELGLSARGTDLGEVLHQVPRVLVRFEENGLAPPEGVKPLPKTVFLLSDMQRRDVVDASGRLVDQSLRTVAKEIEGLGGSLVLVDVAAEEPINASVTHLASREPVVGEDLPCHLEVLVRNWSVEDLDDLTLEYFVDGAVDPQGSVSLTIPAGEEVAPEPLRYVFHEPGPHRVAVHLSSDDLTLDNWRHYVVDVRESVRVLLVDGEQSHETWESETDFVREVLALSQYPTDDGHGLLYPEVIDEAALAGRRLDEYDVVHVANVVSLDEEVTAALESYARNGGAVIFSMGGLVDPDRYNEVLWREGAGLFPCQLLEVQGGTRAQAELDEDAPSYGMAVGNKDHPIASIFATDDMITHLRLPSIFGFYRASLPLTLTEAAEDEEEPATADETGLAIVPIRVVARSADDEVGGEPREGDVGQPMLVERAFGRGRAVVWLSTSDYGWNNCVLYDGFFVPFWRQLVLYLAQQARPPLNLPIGGRFERLFRPEEYAANVEAETPDGRRESLVLEKLEDQDLYRLVYPQEPDPDQPDARDRERRDGADYPGLYTITRKNVAGAAEDPLPDYFAVGLDTTEGDLAKFGKEELSNALEVPLQSSRWELTREVLKADTGAGGAQEYWKLFLGLMLGLLALESILAAAFGRNRR